MKNLPCLIKQAAAFLEFALEKFFLLINIDNHKYYWMANCFDKLEKTARNFSYQLDGAD